VADDALSVLGEREGRHRCLQEAIAAHRAALSVFVEAGAEPYVQICNANIDRTEQLLKK
jgi:hypothetical protein